MSEPRSLAFDSWNSGQVLQIIIMSVHAFVVSLEIADSE